MSTKKKQTSIITLIALIGISGVGLGILVFSLKIPVYRETKPNVDSPQQLRGIITRVEQGKDGVQVKLQTEYLLYNVTISRMQTEVIGSFDQIAVGAEIEVSGRGIARMDPPLIVAEHVWILGSSTEITGNTWVLTAYNDQQQVSEHQPTLRFESGQVSGTTGCNHYGGSYQVNDGTIKIEGIYSTEMACEDIPGIMDQEKLYLEILGAAQSFKVTDGLLTIFAENGKTLTYQPLPESLSDQDLPVDNQATINQINPTDEPEPTQPANIFEPPAGFKEYQDSQTGISIHIPEEWYIDTQNIVEGDYAIFSSYPPDKYIGGEGRQPGDTKCDLNLNPDIDNVDDLIQQRDSSPLTTIVSEEEFVLNSGISGVKIVIDSMGRSTTMVTKINRSLVKFTCWGEFELFDEIAVTLHADDEISP